MAGDGTTKSWPYKRYGLTNDVCTTVALDPKFGATKLYESDIPEIRGPGVGAVNPKNNSWHA